MGFFDRLKETFSGNPSDILNEAEGKEYVELGSEESGKSDKIVVRSYMMTDFESIKPILDALREGNTVAFINIKPLKDKDLVELKRAVTKLKKTCDAIDGDIAGLGEDWIAAVPSFGRIQRAARGETKKPAEGAEVTEYSSREPSSGDEGPDQLKIDPY